MATDLISLLFRFALLLPAIVLHEASHGYAAFLMGDPTAKRAGRLSLNPAKHVDLVGTIIVPGVLLLSGSTAVFGWAKPVPVNPAFFHDRSKGMLLTGIAGPAANLALAAVAGFLYRLLPPTPGSLGGLAGPSGVLLYFAFLNLLLLFFNLIPIPGLDGSRVVQWFLKPAARAKYNSLERYAFLFVFGLLLLAPGLVDMYFRFTIYPVLALLTGVGL